jgi:polysaccharide export outer membrane protein
VIDRNREDALGFQSSASGSTRGARTLRKSTSLGLLALFAMMGTVACSTTLTPAPAKPTPTAYRVGAPDQLMVRILPEPEVILDVTVRPDGMISIPLVGDVAAGGRTIPQIASDIEVGMNRFKRGAQVTVMLSAALHPDISVLGEVARSSSFPLVKETRVVEAIAQVGGPSLFAWSSRIRVIRNLDGETEVHRVNLKDIQRGDQTTNMFLEPGDIVYVPPTILARIGYAINSVFFPFQPLFGLARMGAGGIP